MKKQNAELSLNTQILMATSPVEVEALLLKGNSFAEASPATKRRWKRNAQRKLKEFQTAGERTKSKC